MNNDYKGEIKMDLASKVVIENNEYLDNFDEIIKNN